MFERDGRDGKKTAMYSSMHGGKPCLAMDLTNITSNRVRI